jgi:hypothetical protein
VGKSLVPYLLPGNPTLSLHATTKQYVDLGDVVLNVKASPYPVYGDGVTDDAANINATIAAAPAGSVIWFPVGTYLITAPIVVPSNITLQGVHGDTIAYASGPASPCVIKVAAGFVGAGAIRLLGAYETGSATDHVGARLVDVTVDGAIGPAGVRGFQVVGLVREAMFLRCTARDMTDTGFWFGLGGNNAAPQSCRLASCLADGCDNNGYTFTNVPDSTLIDCNSLGATNAGFFIAGFMNGQIANCRAEWSGHQGFCFTSGYWGTGQGSGGASILNCSTDRNGQDGIMVDAAGSAHLIFTNCLNRRDGRNNKTGGGGYAGIALRAPASGSQMPISVVNHAVYPGVDDDGTGVNSPQYGVYATAATSAMFISGYVHAATTAIQNGGSNTSFVVDNSVMTATGTSAAPVRAPNIPDALSNRQILPGTGLTGGGDLTADRTLAVNFGQLAGMAVQGSDLSRFTPTPSDAYLYGDYWSSLPRHAATFSTSGKSLGSGNIYAVSGIAAVGFTARILRFAVGVTAGAGGNLMLALYTGASLAAMTQRATITTMTTTTANTLYQPTLSTTYAITPGTYVSVLVLSTMATTAPVFASLNGAQSMVAGFINPDTTRYYAANGPTAQTVLPATVNISGTYSASALPFWAALSI